MLAASWPVERWRDVTVLAAVSGGADSVAMLLALAELRQATAGAGRIVVAHFHHGLRGAEADADAQFVAALSANLGLEWRIGRRDSGGSPIRADERSARTARYRFLRETAHSCGARFVVVAHTADDRAETILQAIARGTGLAGLAGIPRRRRLGHGVTLIRPLLAIRRTDVANYLYRLGREFRDDSTNENRAYTRNFIRHEIVPRLQQNVNRRAVENVLRLGELAREANRTVLDRVRALHQRAVRYEPAGAVQIELAAIAGERSYMLCELAIAIWRRRRWPRRSLSRRHLRRLASWLKKGDSGAALSMPGGIHVERRGECAVLWKTPQGDEPELR